MLRYVMKNTLIPIIITLTHVEVESDGVVPSDMDDGAIVIEVQRENVLGLMAFDTWMGR